jgi:hypothetical protein
MTTYYNILQSERREVLSIAALIIMPNTNEIEKFVARTIFNDDFESHNLRISPISGVGN